MGDRTCLVANCETVPSARGWCEKHYQRWRKTGDPEVMVRKTLPAEERFWPKVDVSGVCWEWIAGTNREGYGKFRDGTGTNVLAHRWTYLTLVGSLGNGLELDHLCRNRLCVNPDHLEPVTHSENIRRGTWVMRHKSRKR